MILQITGYVAFSGQAASIESRPTGNPGWGGHIDTTWSKFMTTDPQLITPGPYRLSYEVIMPGPSGGQRMQVNYDGEVKSLGGGPGMPPPPGGGLIFECNNPPIYIPL